MSWAKGFFFFCWSFFVFCFFLVGWFFFFLFLVFYLRGCYELQIASIWVTMVKYLVHQLKPGVVVHVCNSSACVAEAGKLWLPGHLRLHWAKAEQWKGWCGKGKQTARGERCVSIERAHSVREVAVGWRLQENRHANMHSTWVIVTITIETETDGLWGAVRRRLCATKEWKLENNQRRGGELYI